MSQSKLSSFYNTRKRRTDCKSLKLVTNDPIQIKDPDSLSKIITELTDEQLVKAPPHVTETFFQSTKSSHTESNTSATKQNAKAAPKSKVSTKKTKATKPKAQSKSKKLVNEKNERTADIRASFQAQLASKDTSIFVPQVEQSVLNTTYTVTEANLENSDSNLVRTPKRNLSSPDESNVDSKKKKKCDSSVSEEVSITNDDVLGTGTPNNHSEPVKKHFARKNLFVDYESESLLKKNSKIPIPSQKSLEAKMKLIPADKLEGLKVKLADCDRAIQKLKEFKDNKFKITSVISTNASTSAETTEKEEPSSEPCYIKYHNLALPTTTLSLPYKYKMLSEIFRCSDTVVSMLNNRKEICTFDKLKNGVQDMTKRNFSSMHLGQVKTVFPLAYYYNIEKNSAAVINRKPGTPQYELSISPNLENYRQEVKGSFVSGSSIDSFKCTSFKMMTPACLIERKNIFNSNLLNITKNHHKLFLEKLNPPVRVPIEKITRWHPKFPIDSIPDIQPSELPKLPNQQKVSSAKDVLDKIRGTAGEKIEKALQMVADKHSEQDSTQSTSDNKASPCRFLRNISSDILQRIRARESAKIVENMTRPPKDKKRMEMLERLPEIIRILRTYFITERRAAISLEDATEKIMDSYHTTLNPEDIKQHLQLIADTFPKWLTLIPIRKGLFLKIDKNKDINVLLDNIPTG